VHGARRNDVDGSSNVGLRDEGNTGKQVNEDATVQKAVRGDYSDARENECGGTWELAGKRSGGVWRLESGKVHDRRLTDVI